MCDVQDLLKSKGVKPTPVRVMIYEVMKGYENTFSLTDLENNLLDVDKSTLLVSVQNKAKPDDLLLTIAASIKSCTTNGKLPSKKELSAVLQELKMIGKNYKIKELKKPIADLTAYLNSLG